MSEFSIDTEELGPLGRQIGIEGNNFEEQISSIQQKIDECGNYWKGETYQEFRNQTAAAASKLTTLRNFFAQYGQDVYKFSNQSQDAMNTIRTSISSRY